MPLIGTTSCIQQDDAVLSNLRSEAYTGEKPDELKGDAIPSTGKKDGSVTGTFNTGASKNSTMMAGKAPLLSHLRQTRALKKSR